MRLPEFKLIDKTSGALTWSIIERLQRMVEELPKNSIKYLSSTVAQSKNSSIVIDMDISKKELIISRI